MLSRLLAKLGDHRVQIVHDGTAALTTAQLHRFDLILLDIGLPKVDGYEVPKQSVKCRVVKAFALLHSPAMAPTQTAANRSLQDLMSTM